MKWMFGSLLFVIVFGMLPLWFANWVVVAGEQNPRKSGYRAAAPRGLYVGVAYCSVTQPVAVLPKIVHQHTMGDG